MMHKSGSELAEACGDSLLSVKLWKRKGKAQGAAGLSAKGTSVLGVSCSNDDLARLENLSLAGTHKPVFPFEL
jgi:hypothetical protein